MNRLLIIPIALAIGRTCAPAFAADPATVNTPDSAIANAPVNTKISAAAMANPDPQALSSFAPMEVQDALVLPEGVMEFQGYQLFTRNPYVKSNQNTFLLSPTLKVGAFHHVQLDITAPYQINGNTPNAGSAGIDGYYQFTDPAPYFPALATQVGYTFTGYGPGKTSNSYFVRGLLTQWLGGDKNAPRLDANVGWTHVTTPLPGNRSDIWTFGLGYTQRLNAKTAFVADIVHDYQPVNDKVQNFVDGGVRYIVGGGWTVTGVVGPGFGPQSPAFRTLFSFQKDFSLF
jgi:hypothetical protein